MVTKMQLRLLKQETQIITNEQSPVKVAPASWTSWGEVKPLYCDDGHLWGFLNVSTADDIPISSDDLPIEFYNHEVADFTGNEGDICAFLGRFGAPYLPDESAAFAAELGAVYVELLRGRVAVPDDIAAMVDAYIMESWHDELEFFYDELLWQGEYDDDIFYGFAVSLRDMLKDRVITFKEVALSLGSMQGAFRSILAAIDGAIDEPNAQGFYDGAAALDNDAFRIVNFWTYYPDMAGRSGQDRPRPYGAMVGAISSQFVRTLKDPEPWRRCRCCGRLFKRKAVLTDRHRFNHPKRAPRDLITFCSNRCEFKYNKRKQRGNNPSDKANERNGGR